MGKPRLLDASFTVDNPAVVAVKITTVEGATIRKNISTESFLQMIKAAIDDDVDLSSCRWGGVPEGLIDISFHSKGNFIALTQVPAGVYLVDYCNNKYSIPFPSLLFYTKVLNGRVTSSKVFAVKEDRVTKNTELYNYPFGNVHENGNICWGSNQLPNINMPLELNIIPRLFLSAPTNSDLWRADKRLNLEGVEPILSKVYEHLNGKEKFPLNVLIKTKYSIDALFKN